MIREEKTCGGDSQAKLAHGMKSRGTPIKELLDELWNRGAGGPVLRQFGNLFWSGDLSGQQEPEETLRQWFATTGSFRKELLTFRNCLATEANPLIWNG